MKKIIAKTEEWVTIVILITLLLAIAIRATAQQDSLAVRLENIVMMDSTHKVHPVYYCETTNEYWWYCPLLSPNGHDKPIKKLLTPEQLLVINKEDHN